MAVSSNSLIQWPSLDRGTGAFDDMSRGPIKKHLARRFAGQSYTLKDLVFGVDCLCRIDIFLTNIVYKLTPNRHHRFDPFSSLICSQRANYATSVENCLLIASIYGGGFCIT